MKRARTRTVIATALALAFAACSRSSPPPREAAGPPPRSEFLLVAGDSSFWVRTGSAGTRVRGAPLALAHYGGRFYEVYVGDDDRSYFDAVFVGQRIFRRDLVTGDSAQVYGDTAIAVAARRYGATHPDEDPLDPDEEGSEHPRLSLTTEVDLVASHGPYLTFDVRAAREVGGDLASSSTRRAVLDLRTGRRLRVADVVGGERSAAIVAEGRRRFVAALDSVRAARDERAIRAQRALGQFTFDPTSFGLDAVGRAPAIEFLVPGAGDEAGGLTLPLEPILVQPAPPWWEGLATVFPESLRATGVADGLRWPRAGGGGGGGGGVEAHYDSARAAYTLLLRGVRRDGAGGEWPIGRVHGPVRQLYWLDDPPLDSASRHALARAFDESALYSEEARTVAWTGAPRSPSARHLHRHARRAGHNPTPPDRT